MDKATLEKYDRQIRLWGVDGQAEIESAIICALGSDVINSEILKNMVLHAVGHVIIVDDAKVTEDDVGVNFLVEQEYIGQNRAEIVAKLLNEMNPDPEIKTIIRSPTDLSVLDEPVFTDKTIVISYGNYSPEFLAQLSDKVRSKGFRQLHSQTTGFYGAFYLDAGNHYALEGGTEAESPNDLRIYKPFPELKEYLESYDITNMKLFDIEQLPYIVPLYWARQKFLKENNATKVTYKDVETLRQILTTFDPENQLGVIETAKVNALAAMDPIALQSALETCYNNCDTMPQDSPFWKVIRAARDFYKAEGVPVHCGIIPDIDCSSTEFKKIKEIYHKKGQEDAEKLISMCPDVDPEFVRKYVKFSWRAYGYQYRPLKELILQPYDGYPFEPKDFAVQITQALFIASRAFVGKNNRVPTIGDEEQLCNLTLESSPTSNKEEVRKFVDEFCRFKGTILPSVAATLAAIAAQELTKVIIRKATPMKGILVYDGIHGYIE